MIINVYVMKESQQKKQNDGNITKPPGSCNYEKRSGNYEMKERERVHVFEGLQVLLFMYTVVCMLVHVYERIPALRYLNK